MPSEQTLAWFDGQELEPHSDLELFVQVGYLNIQFDY